MMPQEISQSEIDFIKARYPHLQTAVVEALREGDQPTIIMSRSLDPTKIKVSRRRLNTPAQLTALGTECVYCRRAVHKPGSAEAIDDPKCTRTREHVIPKCDGGTIMVTACKDCNETRGSCPVEVFIAFLETNPPRDNRKRAFRLFTHELMREALRAQQTLAPDAPIGFEFVPAPRSKYTMKDLRKDRGE